MRVAMSTATDTDKPTQIRLPRELKTRIARIAEVNHIAEVDVIRLCLAQTIPTIEQHGLTILPPSAPTKRRAKAA